MKLSTIVWATQFVSTNLTNIPADMAGIKDQFVQGVQINPRTSYTNLTNSGEAELRETPGYLFAKTTVDGNEYHVPLSNVKSYVLDRTTYYTQLDLELINIMTDVLDISDLISNELSLNIHQKVILDNELKGHGAWVDSNGTFAILDPALATAFKEKFATSSKETVNCFKTARLFQGAFPSIDLDKQTVGNLTTGGRFFLYRMNLKLHSGETVPFIGVAVFAEDTKIFKYTNSKNILKHLVNFTQGKTKSILFPESFRKESLGAGQYYEEFEKLLGPVNKDPKWEAVNTFEVVSSALPQLKMFAAAHELNHRPSTKTYLDLQRKHTLLSTDKERIQHEIDRLQGSIERARANIISDEERVAALQSRIAQTKTTIQAEETAKSKSEADIIPLSKMVQSTATQVAELASTYKKAIKNEWSSLTGLGLFNEWLKMGMLIKELVITNKTSGAHVQDEAKIAEIFAEGQQNNYRIEKLVIWTTAPSRIVADGHDHSIDPKNRKIYAGGPYIVTVEDANMTVRLLDDRSLRATWLDGSTRYFKVHPHCNHMTKYESDFKKDPQRVWKEVTQAYTSVCTGELGPTLLKGSNELDLRLLMYGIKGWLENAVTGDSWGRYVDRFPLASKVKFEQFGIGTRDIDGAALFESQTVYVNSEKKLASIYLSCKHKLTIIDCDCETTETEWRLSVKQDETISFLSTADADATLAKLVLEKEALGFKQVLKEKDVKEAKLVIPVPPPVPESPQRKLTEAKIAELKAYIASLAQTAAA